MPPGVGAEGAGSAGPRTPQSSQLGEGPSLDLTFRRQRVNSRAQQPVCPCSHGTHERVCTRVHTHVHMHGCGTHHVPDH